MATSQRFAAWTCLALVALAFAPIADAALGSYGSIVTNSSTNLSGKFTGAFASAQVVYQDTDSDQTPAGTAGTTNNIYLDLNGNSQVDQNDVVLYGASLTAGSSVTTAITSNICTGTATCTGGTALKNLLRFKDSLPAYSDGGPDGKFNPGETLFFDLNTDGLLNAGDVTVTTSSARQASADTDSTWNGGTECIVQSTGSPSAVAAGQIRLTTCTAGAAGAVVASANSDVGNSVTSIGSVLMTTPASSRTVADAATTASGTTVTSATAAFVACDLGSAVSGTNIPGGATITAVTSGTQITISSAATATGTGGSLTIAQPGARTIPAAAAGATTLSSTTLTTTTPAFCASDVGRTVSGTNIPGGATIVAFGSSTSVTLSAAATATGATGALSLGANTALFQSGQNAYIGSGSTVTSGMYRLNAYAGGGGCPAACPAATVVDCTSSSGVVADADCGKALTSVSGSYVALTSATYAAYSFPSVKWLDMDGTGSYSSADRLYFDGDASGFVSPADVRLNNAASATFGSRPVLSDNEVHAAALVGTLTGAKLIFQDTDADSAVDPNEAIAFDLDGDTHFDFGDVPVASLGGCTAGTVRIGTTTCGQASSGTWKLGSAASPKLVLCYHDDAANGPTRGDGVYAHQGADCTSTVAANDVRITQSIVGGTAFAAGAQVPASGSDQGISLLAVTLGTTFTLGLFDNDGSGTASALDLPYIEIGAGNGNANPADARLNGAGGTYGNYLSSLSASTTPDATVDHDAHIELTSKTPAFGFIDVDGTGGRSLGDPIYLLPGTGPCGNLAAIDLHLSAGRSNEAAGTNVGGSSESGMACTAVAGAKFSFLPASSAYSTSSRVVVDLSADALVSIGDVDLGGAGLKVGSTDVNFNAPVTDITLGAALAPRANNVGFGFIDLNGDTSIQTGEPMFLDIDGDATYSTGDVLLLGSGGTTSLAGSTGSTGGGGGGGGGGVVTPPVTSSSSSSSTSTSTTNTDTSSATSTTASSSTGVTNTISSTTDATTDTDTDTGGLIPGFGVSAGLVALGAVLVLARRRLA